mmetsp:Transcript_9928/g.14627  ORF Transcript_9928/g.14627 Transcript_9928/m.14627 type:complete len:306 (-) Transcript_9928:43-960(-)
MPANQVTTSDRVIWMVLNKTQCSYQFAPPNMKERFCTHPKNVDGQCKKMFCPLANGQYATVVEEEGKIFLCLKTAERQHLPADWWEKIQLDEENGEEVIQEHLQYFVHGGLIKRNKERYHRLVENLQRIRRIRSEVRGRVVNFNKKSERRLRSREKKALVAAKLNENIEKEMLKRLHAGVYNNMYDDLMDKEEEEELDKHEIEARKKEKLAEKEFVEDQKDIYADLDDMGIDYESDYASGGEEDDIEDIVGRFEFDDWEERKKQIKKASRKRIRSLKDKRRKLRRTNDMNIEYEEEEVVKDREVA